MKKLKCDLCDYEAAGETFEEWMNALKPHYADTHADVMQSKKGTPEEMIGNKESHTAKFLEIELK